MRSERGFSLVEVVIVMIVLAIIAAAASPVIRNSLRAYNGIQDDVVALDKVRYVTERLAREIREVAYSGGAYSFTSLSATAPVFTKADGITVTVAQSGTTATLGYSTPTVTSTLVDNLTTLSFAYYDKDNATTASTSSVKYVQISLTLTVSGQTYSERTRVQLRNQ